MAQPFTRDYPARRSRRLGRGGCIALLIVILLLVGVAAYLFAGALGANLPGFGRGQAAVTTTPLHITLPYKGADVTIVDARQAANFADDPGSASDGMVRLDLRESNATSVPIAWSYNDVARLILPGRRIVRPTYAPGAVSLAPGKTQSSIVDFAVPGGASISSLTLRLGSANEAQEDIRLSGKANPAVYMPVTASVNGSLLYFGLNYTLKSATTSLFLPGQQARQGMRYVSLTVSVDNTLSQEAIPGSPFEYARLQYARTSASPVDTSLPVSFNAGAAGVTGTITFLVPQKTTAFTLVFVPQSHDSGDQASVSLTLT